MVQFAKILLNDRIPFRPANYQQIPDFHEKLEKIADGLAFRVLNSQQTVRLFKMGSIRVGSSIVMRGEILDDGPAGQAGDHVVAKIKPINNANFDRDVAFVQAENIRGFVHINQGLNHPMWTALLMKDLGKSAYDLRKDRFRSGLPVVCALKMTYRAARVLQAIHIQGFIHGNIQAHKLVVMRENSNIENMDVYLVGPRSVEGGANMVTDWNDLLWLCINLIAPTPMWEQNVDSETRNVLAKNVLQRPELYLHRAFAGTMIPAFVFDSIALIAAGRATSGTVKLLLYKALQARGINIRQDLHSDATVTSASSSHVVGAAAHIKRIHDMRVQQAGAAPIIPFPATVLQHKRQPQPSRDQPPLKVLKMGK